MTGVLGRVEADGEEAARAGELPRPAEERPELPAAPGQSPSGEGQGRERGLAGARLGLQTPELRQNEFLSEAPSLWCFALAAPGRLVLGHWGICGHLVSHEKRNDDRAT